MGYWVRAENIARIRSHAADLGVDLNTEVFATRESWQDYAIASLQNIKCLAAELGLRECLHLWPDKSLGNSSFLRRSRHPEEHRQWLDRWWNRISEWPKGAGPSS